MIQFRDKGVKGDRAKGRKQSTALFELSPFSLLNAESCIRITDVRPEFRRNIYTEIVPGLFDKKTSPTCTLHTHDNYYRSL